MKRRDKIKIIHNAPKKHGKQEVRYVSSMKDAIAYLERNQDRFQGVTAAEQIERKRRTN